MSNDAAFVGSIPAVYERYLGSLLFEPYAADLAARVRESGARRILETAAGTGIVTRALSDTLPDAAIVATDLNPGMIAHAQQQRVLPNVRWEIADATSLPFADGAFDLVVCQFGAMFFPDRAAAYREARRVLTSSGHYLMNVWGALEENEVAQITADTIAAAFPHDPPLFLRRTPFALGDPGQTEAELRAAGFDDVRVERLDRRGRAASAHDAALGLCQGSPARGEIEARDPRRVNEVTNAAAHAIAARYGNGPFEPALRAYVFDARR